MLESRFGRPATFAAGRLPVLPAAATRQKQESLIERTRNSQRGAQSESFPAKLLGHVLDLRQLRVCNYNNQVELVGLRGAARRRRRRRKPLAQLPRRDSTRRNSTKASGRIFSQFELALLFLQALAKRAVEWRAPSSAQPVQRRRRQTMKTIAVRRPLFASIASRRSVAVLLAAVASAPPHKGDSILFAFRRRI